MEHRTTVGPAGPPAWAVPCRLGQGGAVIGRLHHVIVDCPGPVALAGFYAELLGLPVTWQEDDFAVVARDDKSPAADGFGQRLTGICGPGRGILSASYPARAGRRPSAARRAGNEAVE
jgi:hypothetical protein